MFKFLIILTTCILYQSVFSQQLLGLSYNVGMPVGEMRDFVDETSYVGFGVEGRQFKNQNLAYGLSFGWNKFQQESINQTGNVNEIEDHLVDSFPLLLNLDYYLFDEVAKFRPYGGLNAGIYFINARKISSTSAFKDKGFHFGFAPEIGFLTELSYDLKLMVFMRYNYAFKSAEYSEYTYISIHFSFVSISIL